MGPYKVTEVNKYINQTLSTDILLSDIAIEGEISDFVHHRSGHMYFDLKDKDSRIRCVMFKSYNQKLKVEFKDGLKVILRGYISVYENQGLYQFYVKDAEDLGLGELFKKFEELKKKLDKEGLFDLTHKKNLPKMPSKIGIVTSSTGAAIRDIINVVKRRYPIVDLLIYPALVQGNKAVEDIMEGLIYLDNREDIDLIIFGRGGGSTEELFLFNNENLARCIFDLKTPNIAAIGHEIDITIADLVSDLRAPTPSAAAELAVPNISDFKIHLDNIYDNLIDEIYKKLYRVEDLHRSLYKEMNFLNPIRTLRDNKVGLDVLMDKLLASLNLRQGARYKELLEIKGDLDILNPNLAIEKGYGIILDQDNKKIRDISQVSKDMSLTINLRGGQLKVYVEEIWEDESFENR